MENSVRQGWSVMEMGKQSEVLLRIKGDKGGLGGGRGSVLTKVRGGVVDRILEVRSEATRVRL